jgi:ribonuclease HI
MSLKLIIYTDGGARGNPGPAGVGAVIADETGKIISLHKKYIGNATNNSAEYQALILALQEALRIINSKSQIPNETELEIRMDSELIVRQMQGKYKIKEPQLKVFAAEVLKLSSSFKRIGFQHVPREQNKQADKLVNEAIDRAT